MFFFFLSNIANTRRKSKQILNFFFIKLKEWDQKAAEAKDRYTKLIKEFEANGGSKEPAGRKRTKGAKKPAVKKSKKKAESEDEEASEDESD